MTIQKPTSERMVPDQHVGTLKYAHHVQRYQFAARHVKGKHVLDVACGTGYGSRILADANAESVVGLDISPQALEYAQTHYAHNKVSFEQKDAQEDLGTECYDLVVSFETLEHLKQPERFLRCIRKALKARGELIISTPNRTVYSPGGERPSNPYHHFELTMDEFCELLVTTGFEVAETWGQIFPVGPRKGFGRIIQRTSKALRRAGLSRAWPTPAPKLKKGRGDAPILLAVCRTT